MPMPLQVLFCPGSNHQNNLTSPCFTVRRSACSPRRPVRRGEEQAKRLALLNSQTSIDDGGWSSLQSPLVLSPRVPRQWRWRWHDLVHTTTREPETFSPPPKSRTTPSLENSRTSSSVEKSRTIHSIEKSRMSSSTEKSRRSPSLPPSPLPPSRQQVRLMLIAIPRINWYQCWYCYRYWYWCFWCWYQNWYHPF